MVAWHSCNKHIDMLALALNPGDKCIKFLHEFPCVIPQAFLNTWHLEVIGFKLLIAEVLAQRIRKSALATAWNTSD